MVNYQQFAIQKCGENIRCLYYKGSTSQAPVFELNNILNVLHSAGQDVSSTENFSSLFSLRVSKGITK